MKDRRIYKVAVFDTYMNDLYIVKYLAETNKTIQEQEQEFINRTKKCRATFYRYRQILKLRSNKKKFNYKLKNKGICYFCLRMATIIHHINENNKDNRKENRLPLCKSCHTKIHLIYKSYFKVANDED